MDSNSSTFSWLLLLLVIVPILPLLPLLFTKYQKRRARPAKLPPGPRKLPVIGNLHQLRKLPHRDLWLLSKMYGPLIYLQLGHVPTLIVSSAAMAREVMKSNDLDLCTRPPLVSFKKLSYSYSDVAFVPYGEYWREMKKICIVELFSTKRVQSFAYIREEEVAEMMRSIARSSSCCRSINLSEMLVSLTNNIICKAAFGKSFEGGSKHEQMEFHRAIREAGAMLGGFFIEDFLPLMGWMDVLIGLRGRLERCFLKLDAFYERVIDEHLRCDGAKLDREDFVHVLLQVQKESSLTKDQMKGILMNILIGGTDTSSTSVVWAMAELLRNPKTMAKAQDEVRTIVGRKGKVDEKDLHQLQYLKSIIKETLRLHPPAPLLIPRESMRQCSIGGYEVAPKTRFYINAFAIGRDPMSWENPEEFFPERFMGSSIDYKGQDFKLVPFGAGRRSCPGMLFGTVTIELTLANLLYSFNWELPAGLVKENMDMNEAFGIIVHKESALQVVPVAGPAPWLSGGETLFQD
ncbi:cytochrome P450 71A1-like [Magnolia sinica]|uniref:cytochrome P450 71A1-like n=1 Tax=Magnolia sinica TaxID=86752 RepID=UPI00265986F1|nr:cytochrome P450 71A1-like [Magnolia sinica]